MTDVEQFDQLIVRVDALAAEPAAREAREFFAALPPAAAAALVGTRTDQVARLDGSPARLRYQANRLRLLTAADRLRSAVAAGRATAYQRTRLATVEELLAPVTTTGTDATGRLAPIQRDRQFLAVETTGRGRAVEVLGDLDQAAHVAVLVPGIRNQLESLRSLADRADLIRSEAGPGTATVVWLDYESPAGVIEASSKQPAKDAIDGLRRFRAGLGTELSPGADLTLIGHSYGSQVIGQALLAGVRCDRVIFTGSPGIDRSVRSAADLVPPETLVFAARAPGDYVSYTEWHGPDPVSFPDVVTMRTDGGAASVRYHDGYYAPNSQSLHNVGLVVRGEVDKVSTTNTRPAAETRLARGISWAPPLRGAVASTARVLDGVAALRVVRAPAEGSGHQPGRSPSAGRRSHRPDGPAR